MYLYYIKNKRMISPFLQGTPTVAGNHPNHPIWCNREKVRNKVIIHAIKLRFLWNSICNVWCIKFRSKHSSNTVLCLLRNLMHQTLCDLVLNLGNTFLCFHGQKENLTFLEKHCSVCAKKLHFLIFFLAEIG